MIAKEKQESANKESRTIQWLITIIIWTAIIVLLTIGFMRCMPYPEPNNYLAIVKEVAEEIAYKADIEDHWQFPLETENLGTGDCEDMTILSIWRVFLEYNVRGSMVLVTNRGYLHAVASFDDGLLYDSTAGIIFDLEQFESEIVFKLSFQTIFMVALAKDQKE